MKPSPVVRARRPGGSVGARSGAAGERAAAVAGAGPALAGRAWRGYRERVALVELSGTGLEPAEVIAVARDGAPVGLTRAARELMQAGAAAVQRALQLLAPAR